MCDPAQTWHPAGMRKTTSFLGLACLVLFLGCGGSDGDTTGTPTTDSGSSSDGKADGSSDGTSGDSSADTGSTGDALADSGDDATDSGSSTDTGSSTDSGTAVDSGTKTDAITIDAPKKDSGGGTIDSGAGCPPTAPKDGDPCAPDGLKCPYGSFTVCYCTGGKWACAV